MKAEAVSCSTRTFNSLHTEYCFMIFVVWRYISTLFSKISFRNTTRVLNSLNPDQARHFVGPDMDPNYLQWLPANDEIAASRQRVKVLHFSRV